MREIKPDGWVAHDPNFGPDAKTFSRISGRHSMALCIKLNFESGIPREPMIKDTRVPPWWANFLKYGWRIRPVKLVYLDEGK